MLKTILSKFKRHICEDARENLWPRRYYSLFDQLTIDDVAARCKPGAFLDELALALNISATTIREAVSNEFGLPLLSNVLMPSDEFLATFHSGYEPFAEFASVPQPLGEPETYSLVVSNPALISLDAFRRQGIEVCLGDYSSISRVLSLWKEKYAHGNARSEKFLIKAYELGCRSLCITDDENDGISYRFETADGIMGGKLSRQFYSKLRRECLPGILSLSMPAHGSVSARVNSLESDDRKLLLEFISDSRQSSEPSQMHLQEKSRPSLSMDIMLVEDDILFGQTLTDILEAKGYSVCCACSVDEFEQSINAGDLDVKMVISDYRLGGRNGKEIIEACAKYSTTIPIVFLTSDEDPVTQASLIQLGTHAFVKKSENPMILLAWVSRILNGLSNVSSISAEMGAAA